MLQEPIDVDKLGPLQRIILTSNGTVTKLLEDLMPANQQVIQRKICLQGKDSGINWLYAESIIIPERLESSFRDDLLESQIPIGNLWSKYKIETFKEILPPFKQTAGELGQYFSIPAQKYLLGRTYRVYSRQQAVMMLTEKFPAHYFIDLTHHVHFS